MTRKKVNAQAKKFRWIMMASMIPLILTIVLVQIISAQELVQAAELEIIKESNSVDVVHGEKVGYTINISNIGDSTAFNVLMTDTVPAELIVLPASLEVVGGGDSWGIEDNNITWTGPLAGNGGGVTINFDAIVSNTVPTGPITNTAYVTGTGMLISDDAVVTVTENLTTTIFLPAIMSPVYAPVIIEVAGPTDAGTPDSYNLMPKWTDNNSVGGWFELEESTTPDFSSSTTFNTSSETSWTVTHSASTVNAFYYRVRKHLDNGLVSEWSNVKLGYGIYLDNFSNPSTGWEIRREDTDDTDNNSYYENGNFILKIGGRWDYAIAAPMVGVPWDSYRIETRARFDPSVDNLHSYGLVWGGDWNGQACPNSSFSSCFNHYYRLNIIWYGEDNRLRFGIKRIDYHEDNNAGRGETLMDYENIYVSSSGGWNDLAIEQDFDGEIRLYVNGTLVRTTIDNERRYVGSGTYPGVYATANEYLGSEPWYDYFRISPVNQ